MRPPDEKLTRKQLYVCSGIMAATFVAFSSVFAYAYIKGSQVRMKSAQAESGQASLSLSAVDGALRKKASPIAQGHRGQANNTLFQETAGTNSYWTISKLPVIKSDGPRPAAIVVAYSTSPEGWAIYPTGVVQVPRSAELGFYTLQCSSGEYLFQVIPNRHPYSKRTLKQTYTVQKIAPRNTQRFTSDIALTPSADLRDMEEW